MPISKSFEGRYFKSEKMFLNNVVSVPRVSQNALGNALGNGLADLAGRVDSAESASILPSRNDQHMPGLLAVSNAGSRSVLADVHLNGGTARSSRQEDAFCTFAGDLLGTRSAHSSVSVDKAIEKPGQDVRDVHDQRGTARRLVAQDKEADTAALAFAQTRDARNALYHPGPVLRVALRGAAGTLFEAMRHLPDDDVKAIGDHLFAEGRLLGNKPPQALLAILQRVASLDSATASGTDRATVIALMGDIGESYTSPAAVRAEAFAKLDRAFASLQLEVPDATAIARMRRVGGSKAVGPDKFKERMRKQIGAHETLPFRSGVHDMGRKADDALQIPPDGRIPANRWTLLDIAQTRLDTTTEPLVAHMSGSPSEILQAWGMLRGDPVSIQYVMSAPINAEGEPQSAASISAMREMSDDAQAERYARAAGAAAFLCGLGYHSAVEVLEGTLHYLGQDLRGDGVLSDAQRDAAHVFGHGAATDLMTELFKTNTSVAHRR
jgi:hypothetical protein